MQNSRRTSRKVGVVVTTTEVYNDPGRTDVIEDGDVLQIEVFMRFEPALLDHLKHIHEADRAAPAGSSHLLIGLPKQNRLKS